MTKQAAARSSGLLSAAEAALNLSTNSLNLSTSSL
jgi:hypothetical protein